MRAIIRGLTFAHPWLRWLRQAGAYQNFLPTRMWIASALAAVVVVPIIASEGMPSSFRAEARVSAASLNSFNRLGSISIRTPIAETFPASARYGRINLSAPGVLSTQSCWTQFITLTAPSIISISIKDSGSPGGIATFAGERYEFFGNAFPLFSGQCSWSLHSS
jgi:hypothetical protein